MRSLLDVSHHATGAGKDNNQKGSRGILERGCSERHSPPPGWPDDLQVYQLCSNTERKRSASEIELSAFELTGRYACPLGHTSGHRVTISNSVDEQRRHAGIGASGNAARPGQLAEGQGQRCRTRLGRCVRAGCSMHSIVWAWLVVCVCVAVITLLRFRACVRASRRA